MELLKIKQQSYTQGGGEMAKETRNHDMERFRRFQEVVRVDKLDKGSTALIIVDAQNDFVHDQGYFGKMAEELLIDVKLMREAIPHIKKLAEAMRQAGATVIYSRVWPISLWAAIPSSCLP